MDSYIKLYFDFVYQIGRLLSLILYFKSSENKNLKLH